MNTQPTWLRIAGNRTNIMADNPLCWRLFVDPDLNEVGIKRAVLDGVATPRNNFFEVNREEDARGIFAWIRYYGTVEVRDDVAYIKLLEPPQEQEA